MKTRTHKIMAMIAAVAVLTAATTVYMVVEESEESDAAVGLAVGFAMGFGAGFAAAMFLNSLDNPGGGGSQEEVNAVLRQSEAEKISMSGNMIKNFASIVLPSDVNLWGFTVDHWNRAAELAVTDLWEYGQTYDPDYTLEKSMMRKNIESYVYNWQAAFDNAYTHTLLRHMDMWLPKDHLKDMVASIFIDGTNVDAYGATMDFLTMVSGVSAGSSVYIDASTDTDGHYSRDTSGVLYKLSSGPAVLRDLGTGRTVTITADRTYLDGMVYDGTAIPVKSGAYRIETAGTTIAGPLSKAADVTAADVFGAVMVLSSSGTMSYLSHENGQTVYHSSSATTNVSEFGISVSYVDQNGGTTTKSTLIKDPATAPSTDLVRDWSDLIGKMNYTIDRASVAGEVLWDIFDICEERIPFLAPSSITTSIPGVPLNATQAKAVYLDAMQQCAAAYAKHGEGLTEGLPQTFTKESLSLYVRGDIYYNSSLIAKDAVFTPYSALESQTFTVGGTTAWNNTGYAMVWGSSEDVDGWTGPTNTSEYRLLALGTGYSIDVYQIGANGVPMTTATITPEEISKISPAPEPTPEPTDPPVLGQGRTLIIVALVVIGILLLIGGVYSRSGMLAVIGILLFAAAYLVYDPPSLFGWSPFIARPYT